ncbi:hypothetical protein T05_4505 [Trichinella murrelli]|uniref:Uncharacterized protein n=1 Tax=Trichinella murrelli TaxID=144512 RepID=A0A0V0U9A1_9BILA|nr:hypothetical protein T05_4505 [Trichinella murrelli]
MKLARTVKAENVSKEIRISIEKIFMTLVVVEEVFLFAAEQSFGEFFQIWKRRPLTLMVTFSSRIFSFSFEGKSNGDAGSGCRLRGTQPIAAALANGNQAAMDSISKHQFQIGKINVYKNQHSAFILAQLNVSQ